MIQRNVLSFSEKKVSKNAIIALAVGIVTLAGFLLLILAAVLTSGHVGIVGGLLGVILMILAFFGVFWGIISYDDIRTNQRFKISGIVLNIIVIFIGITLIMIR
ncbi:MAG: DUF6142 family protein [Lachnospiraceae bacterium]|nr:DUF6142 family protein [Lachnospiraceae bacterium]